jgi:putative endonuclease
MTNYQTGHEAEKRAADYLATIGYKIVELNWQTRLCEIDIVAKKNDVIYFVEVKHRKNTNQGGGLDYITPKKLEQMQFAAQLWVEEHKWKKSYELSGIELSGPDYQVMNFVPNIL